MYICKQCGEQQEKGTKAHRKVLWTKEVTYPFRRDANPRQERPESRDDPGGKGTTMIEEILVCEDCI